MPVTFTTNLPDTTGLQLDASVEDELTATWDDVSNNGEYHLELRDDQTDGSGTYQDEATVGEATTAHTITGLLDGEKYSVRIRTQTPYVTGSWLEADSITLMPAPDSLTVDGVTQTSVDLSWAEYADNEIGSKIMRAKEYADGYSGFEEAGQNGADVTTYTDDAVQPGHSYRYKVREFTDWVYAESGVVETTTTASGKPTNRVPTRGWHVELDHPSGTTLTPAIIDNASLEPRLNEQPQARLPIPRNESYLADTLDGAPMRVFKDAEQRPIDELDDVEAQPDRGVLVGVGGTQLERRVQVDVDDRPAHKLVKDLLTTHTDYTANVDAPNSTVEQDVLVRDADSQTALEEFIADWPFAADSPLHITNGELSSYKTCLFSEGENYDAGSLQTGASSFSVTGGEYSGSEAVGLLGSGDWMEFDVQLNHRIPDGSVQVWTRLYYDDTQGNNHGVSVSLDGTTLRSYDGGTINGGLAWRDISVSGGIDPGTHTIRLDCYSTNDANVYVDAVALEDGRYTHTFDNSTGGDGVLDGPEWYPSQLTVETETVPQWRRAVAGALAVTSNDPAGAVELAVSNDNGQTWITASNTDRVEGSFSSAAPYLRGRLTIGRWSDSNSSNSTPATGDKMQSIDVVELFADLDDTPLVLNQSFDDDLVAILQRIAQNTNSIFEVRQTSSGTSVEWSQPGQRSSTTNADVVDYSVTRRRGPVRKVTVKGGRAPARGESVTASVGSAVNLQESDIIAGTESVQNTAGDERYRIGLDYEIDTVQGTLTALSGGRIADGQALSIDYDYKISGSYEHDQYSGDPRSERVEQIPEISSVRGAEQAAKVIVDETSEPLWEADVEIPADEDVPLIEALDLEDVPGEAMAVYELTVTPESLQLRLGSRDRVRDTVERIRSQLSAASERV